MTQLCIGTVKGPGETPNEFTVIAPDPERRVKHGEFVFYHARVDGEERPILGRITARRAVKLFPDGFMADPNVPPRDVAALLGFEDGDDELFELTVTVLGYHSKTFGDHPIPQVPRIGDRLGSNVSLQPGISEIGADPIKVADVGTPHQVQCQ